MLGHRVNELEAELAAQGKLLAERDFEDSQCARPTRRRSASMSNCSTKLRAMTAAGAQIVEEAANSRRPPSRDSCASRATNAPSCRRRRRTDPAAGRRLLGSRSPSIARCYADAVDDIAAEVAELACSSRPDSAIEAMLGGRPPAAVPPANDVPCDPPWRRRLPAQRAARWRHAHRTHAGAPCARLARPPAPFQRSEKNLILRICANFCTLIQADINKRRTRRRDTAAHSEAVLQQAFIA